MLRAEFTGFGLHPTGVDGAYEHVFVFLHFWTVEAKAHHQHVFSCFTAIERWTSEAAYTSRAPRKARINRIPRLRRRRLQQLHTLASEQETIPPCTSETRFWDSLILPERAKTIASPAFDQSRLPAGSDHAETGVRRRAGSD